MARLSGLVLCPLGEAIGHGVCDPLSRWFGFEVGGVENEIGDVLEL